MRPTVGGVVKLVRPKPPLFLRESLRDSIVIPRITIRLFGDWKNFSAEGAEQGHFFRRLSFWNDDDRAVALRVANHGQPDSSIARSSFHDRISGFQQSI